MIATLRCLDVFAEISNTTKYNEKLGDKIAPGIFNMEIYNVDALHNYLDAGNQCKYLYFWGHKNKTETVTKACFSQWYPAPFVEGEITYLTAEHYMMAGKARLFNDEKALAKILAAEHPGDAKKIGRQVKKFEQSVWLEHRFDIVVQGNLLKFSEPSLKEFLLNTGDRIIVEASPRDRIWGVGMSQNNELITDPENWKGLNLLGFALMKVREQLKALSIA